MAFENLANLKKTSFIKFFISLCSGFESSLGSLPCCAEEEQQQLGKRNEKIVGAAVEFALMQNVRRYYHTAAAAV